MSGGVNEAEGGDDKAAANGSSVRTGDTGNTGALIAALSLTTDGFALFLPFFFFWPGFFAAAPAVSVDNVGPACGLVAAADNASAKSKHATTASVNHSKQQAHKQNMVQGAAR